jgi:hypothetical protein
MKTINYIVCLLVLVLFTIPYLRSQGLTIGSSSYIRMSGSPKLIVIDGNFKNNGNYTKATEKVSMAGTTASLMHGSATITDMNDLEISNTGGITTRLKYLYTYNSDIISNSKLTIDTLSYVYVSNLLTNNATSSGLHIKADATKPGGSLAFMNPVENTVQATVEMYSKASWDMGQPSGSQYKWQYFGIPVKTSAYAMPLFEGSYVRKHNEAGKFQGYGSDKLWMQLYPNDAMTNISGYELVQASPTFYTFTGELFNESFTKTLTYTPTTAGSQYPGQHVIGNPYTSAIDIKQITFGANTQAIVYLYNTGTFNNWSDSIGKLSADSTAYTAGQYIAIPYQTAGSNKLPRQIPSMQAFMVKTSTAAEGSVTVNYNAVKQKNFSVQRTKQELLSSIRINLVGATTDNDVMWIFSQEGTTRGYDNGWDGPKLAGDAGTARIQAVEGEDWYQIDAVPDVNGTEIWARRGSKDSNYKLKITCENMMNNYSQLYLKDLETNALIELSQNETEYNFTMTNTSSALRFKILTSAGLTTDINNQLTHFYITLNDQKIVLNNLTGKEGVIHIYNLNGIEIFNTTYSKERTSEVERNLYTGIYIYKAIHENGTVSSGKFSLD